MNNIIKYFHTTERLLRIKNYSICPIVLIGMSGYFLFNSLKQYSIFSEENGIAAKIS